MKMTMIAEKVYYTECTHTRLVYVLAPKVIYSLQNKSISYFNMRSKNLLHEEKRMNEKSCKKRESYIKTIFLALLNCMG